MAKRDRRVQRGFNSGRDRQVAESSGVGVLMRGTRLDQHKTEIRRLINKNYPIKEPLHINLEELKNDLSEPKNDDAGYLTVGNYYYRYRIYRTSLLIERLGSA